MPHMDGVEATRRIVANDPNIRVVILTAGPGNRMLQAALAAGASSYVFKSADMREIVRAVRQAWQVAHA